ncbi:hypothetical protein QPK87_25630 [Kamptonema cortianum]|nr:hypothetical protein [Kamptonema cortianum]MDL5050516.1 hypothetical protein [Oscillatoria amoena NRMC-F 0135]
MILFPHVMPRVFPVMLIALALHFSMGASVSAADGEGIPSTDEAGGGISAVAPPAVSRKLADGKSVFVGEVQINDPREFVSEVGTGVTGAVESTAVRPALSPEQFKGITPESSVLRIVVQLGEGYVDPLAGNGVVMWWCTDGRVLYMQWDWVNLEKPPIKLVWGPNKPI